MGRLTLACLAITLAFTGCGEDSGGEPAGPDAKEVAESGDLTRLALVAGDQVIELDVSADCSAGAEAERVVAPPCGKIDPEPTVVPLPSGDELTLVAGEAGAYLDLLVAAGGGSVPPPTEPVQPLEVIGEGKPDGDDHTFRMKVDPDELDEATFQVTPAVTDSGFVRFNVEFEPVE